MSIPGEGFRVSNACQVKLRTTYTLHKLEIINIDTYSKVSVIYKSRYLISKIVSLHGTIIGEWLRATDDFEKSFAYLVMHIK